jgi:hypothetical protein
MQSLDTLKVCALAAVAALNFVLPYHPARAAGCQALLSQAEMRWEGMRGRLDMPRDFEEKVTHILTRAAELRHQAEIKGCLNKVKEAGEEMDLRETLIRPALKPQR